ncbi:MAG TPA: TIGR00282 family metallophosphoesterase [Myxococcales bacterium]|nr:TIGR00282 family metallophosphoesterase [Myxococcales bacterium]
MKVLFLGDIVGKPGRRAVRELMPRVVGRHQVDLTVANCENAAGGAGITPEAAEELLACQIQVLTSGNHIWDKKDIVPYLEQNRGPLLRPANYPAGSPGKGAMVVETPDGRKLGVLNVEGRVFMKTLDDPFRRADEELAKLSAVTKCILVDMHCEATSEKNAMGVHLDGRVSAVVGSHTHVQTADERILPGGTAYITDVGMCGPLDSIIGVKKELALQRFLTQRPMPFETARNLTYLQGAVVTIDDATGKGVAIERIRERLPD